MTTARKYKYWVVMWVKEVSAHPEDGSKTDIVDNGLCERKSDAMETRKWWLEHNSNDVNDNEYQVVEVWLTRAEASAINNWLEYRSEF